MDENNHILKERPDRPVNLDTKAKIKYSRLKRNILKHVWLVRFFLIFSVVVVVALGVFGTYNFFETLGIGNIFNIAYDFAYAPVSNLASDSGRVNILVMGKAGGERTDDSPDLTDTMMLVSFGITKPNIVVVSIPRDVWVPDIRAKINSAYYWGTQNTPYFTETGGKHSGITFAKSIAGIVVGVPIQYGVVIDFSGFKEVVDALGGIQVNVDNSFTDKMYPILGKENDLCGGDFTYSCRYETITFNSGLQTMNGETALKFVRSRHAEGTEGSDIAREARQQKVIEAIKNKILDRKTLLSYNTDVTLLKIAKKYVETDMDNQKMAILARLAVLDYKTINQHLIPQEMFVNPPVSAIYDQQSVFVPKLGNGKWDDINKWFGEILR